MKHILLKFEYDNMNLQNYSLDTFSYNDLDLFGRIYLMLFHLSTCKNLYCFDIFTLLKQNDIFIHATN